jgi:hypothetical protein
MATVAVCLLVEGSEGQMLGSVLVQMCYAFSMQSKERDACARVPIVLSGNFPKGWYLPTQYPNFKQMPTQYPAWNGTACQTYETLMWSYQRHDGTWSLDNNPPRNKHQWETVLKWEDKLPPLSYWLTNYCLVSIHRSWLVFDSQDRIFLECYLLDSWYFPHLHLNLWVFISAMILDAMEEHYHIVLAKELVTFSISISRHVFQHIPWEVNSIAGVNAKMHPLVMIPVQQRRSWIGGLFWHDCQILL